MAEAREKGLELFREVYGNEAADGMAAYMQTEDFGVECARWTADFSFGTVWSRPGLDRKLRSCVILGMMIALRQQDEVGYHTKMGIANGLTPAEIEEILYTAIPYCGFPAANTAKVAMRTVLAEAGLDKQDQA
jgi:4-carboxymuconolactone decarboxylase